jgi:soluble lytic murein transglycosylase-like protein
MIPFQDKINVAADAHHVDPMLVAGLVSVESNFNPWAWNPEPKYRYFWDVRLNKPFRTLTVGEIISEEPPVDFHAFAGDADQEWWAQQASWGLMQIMGALARERGFKEDYLTKLNDPSTNLDLGCGVLADLLKWAGNDTEQALAAYNGGKVGNQRRPFYNTLYAAKVIAARAVIESKEA